MSEVERERERRDRDRQKTQRKANVYPPIPQSRNARRSTSTKKAVGKHVKNLNSIHLVLQIDSLPWQVVVNGSVGLQGMDYNTVPPSTVTWMNPSPQAARQAQAVQRTKLTGEERRENSGERERKKMQK